MKEKIIAKRYAEAFLGYAKPSIGISGIVAELKSLKEIIRQNREFLDFLDSLEVTYSEKCAFIDKVLKDGFSPEIKNFLKLLLEKNRINAILLIADYIRVNYSHGEAHDALLKTTYPLDTELIRQLKEKLESRLKIKLNLYVDLDGELLGGVQVIIGNTIIDGSVRRRLEELKRKLIVRGSAGL